MKNNLSDVMEIVELADKLADRYLANRTHDPKHWYIFSITPEAHGREALENKQPYNGRESVAKMWVRLHDLLEKIRE